MELISLKQSNAEIKMSLVMKTFVLLCLLLIQTNVIAGPAVYTERGLAVAGYDVVSFHEQHQAVKGKPEFSHVWQGANWIFSSLENREQFAASPERYAPAYGGYCAYAMSKGSLAPPDPYSFTLHQGVLYLNYSMGVQKTWRVDKERYIKRADFYWQSM